MVDGEGGRANRMDTKGNVYLPKHMGYRNYYYRYMESLGYDTVTVCPNETFVKVENVVQLVLILAGAVFYGTVTFRRRKNRVLKYW